MTIEATSVERPKTSPLNDPVIRGYAFQAALVAVLGALLAMAAVNAVTNMRAHGIPTDYSFWNHVAGFDIGQSLIPYSATSTYGRAFWVGLINTLFVSAIGIVFATLLGFIVGVARLSRNLVISKLAMVYVEILRNTPLLLQLLFWYNAILKPLPIPKLSISVPVPTIAWRGLSPAALLPIGIWIAVGAVGALFLRRARSSTDSGEATRLRSIVGWALLILAVLFLLVGANALFFLGEPIRSFLAPVLGNGLLASTSSGVYLNNRGVILPNPQFAPNAGWVGLALVAGVAGAVLYRAAARRRQIRTGEQSPVFWVSVGLIVGLPALAFVALGEPISLNFPVVGKFNITGGLQVFPEFVALVFGLVIYTAAFIAEIVRAGILAVSRGQTEAAYALGLRPGPTLNLVVIPQALRVIIPPLTSQYLNLTKNSSLAVFVGYPDLVQIFAGTVLNQTGAAVQVMAVTMAVYLTISLATSLLMNWYNQRKALVER